MNKFEEFVIGLIYFFVILILIYLGLVLMSSIWFWLAVIGIFIIELLHNITKE